MISLSGAVTTLSTVFKQPADVKVTPDGSVYVADSGNNLIRKIANGIVTTVAGTGHGSLTNGPLLSAEFKQPMGIALDDANNVIVSDTFNHALRKIALFTTTPSVSTIAGNGSLGDVDGAVSSSRFDQPVSIEAHGAIVIADSMNDAVRIVYAQLSFSDLYPRKGDPNGGTSVRLFGTGFVPGATTVTFGNAPATAITFVSSTEMIATTPATPIGSVDVTITTPAGTATRQSAFRFEPPFVSILVGPAGSTVAPGADVQFAATGVAADNSTTDINALVTWSAAPQSFVTISANGLAHAVAAGTATITATLGNLAGSTTLTVQNPEPVPPDPSSIAPRLDQTAIGAFGSEIRFL